MIKIVHVVISSLFLWQAGFVLADQSLPDEREFKRQFRDVANDLRCPTCTGLSVLDSDAPFSKQIKDLVEEKVKEGHSKTEILAFFVDRYGPWILREPPKEGFNILAWVFPVALLTLGPLGVWFFVWRRRRLVHTFGVRSAEEILQEFEDHLLRMKG